MHTTSSVSAFERHRTRHATLTAIVAWCLLLATDAIVWIGGVPALLRLVRSCPLRRRREGRGMGADDALEALRQASVFALHHYRCLKYWAAATFLLRLVGHPASFVIGVTKYPFRSHAWLEYDGGMAGRDEIPGVEWIVIFRA